MMKNNSLKHILKLLKQNRKNIKVPIPSYWNYPNISYTGELIEKNIYDVFINLINDIINKKIHSLKCVDLIIYSALVRTTTAFDFDNDNKLKLKDKYGLRETGTLLRMILLLPLLKELGVTVVYLLPIALNSEKYKKGDAPSLYSIKNFFKLDKYLFDPMLGKYSEKLLNLQFKGFIEAAHIFGMKVILDLIPRTAARDNDLLDKHPDWFYWIKKEHEDDLRPPYIPELPSTAYFSRYSENIYNNNETIEHLKKFVYSPDKLNKKKWNKIKNSKNILEKIEKEFNITTSPAFSDVINDKQPLWKEITFLRLFLDHPNSAKKFLDKNQPPYILYDVIKSSRASGDLPNKKLWDTISNILPYWQRKFNIDGVRIDMAHALPSELEKLIINKAKKINKKFLLIAEELDIGNSNKAKKAGYHAIIGNIWAEEPRWEKGNIKDVFNSLNKIKLPLLATSETHDTPRTVVRKGKYDLHLFTAVLNYFLPNTIPFINSGFELKEIQPMNKGLDSENSNLKLLPRNDLNYNKLALFNFTSLHWDNNSDNIIRIMKYCSTIRKQYPEITKFDKFKKVKIYNENKYVFVYKYRIKNDFKYLIFLVNSNLRKGYKIKFDLKPCNIISVLNSVLFKRQNKFVNSHIKIKHKKNYSVYKLAPGEISVWGVDK